MPRVSSAACPAAKSTSTPQNRRREYSGINKFFFHLTNRNPVKKLNKSDFYLSLYEKLFALCFYNQENYGQKDASSPLGRLLTEKKAFFNITQENPYKFSRAKEKAFLNHMIDKASKSGNLATEKGSQLKELMHGVDDSAADIEKKCPAYTRYQRLKNQYHAKNQPTEYIPSIEVITNDFARTGLLYSKWIH